MRGLYSILHAGSAAPSPSACLTMAVFKALIAIALTGGQNINIRGLAWGYNYFCGCCLGTRTRHHSWLKYSWSGVQLYKNHEYFAPRKLPAIHFPLLVAAIRFHVHNTFSRIYPTLWL